MKRLAILASGLVLALTACGGSAERPTVDEIKTAISDENGVLGGAAASLPDEAVTCVAEGLHESDVSDEALAAFVDGDKDYKGSEEDQSAINDISTDVTECMAEATGTE